MQLQVQKSGFDKFFGMKVTFGRKAVLIGWVEVVSEGWRKRMLFERFAASAMDAEESREVNPVRIGSSRGVIRR